LDYAFGILDIVDEGYGFMRRHGLLPSQDDVYVNSGQVRRYGLRVGPRITGAVRAPREGEKYWGLIRVDSVNGVDWEAARRRPHFNDPTPIHPEGVINLEWGRQHPAPHYATSRRSTPPSPSTSSRTPRTSASGWSTSSTRSARDSAR